MSCPACGLGISDRWTTYTDKPGQEFCARAWCKFFRHRNGNSARAHRVFVNVWGWIAYALMLWALALPQKTTSFWILTAIGSALIMAFMAWRRVWPSVAFNFVMIGVSLFGLIRHLRNQ